MNANRLQLTALLAMVSAIDPRPQPRGGRLAILPSSAPPLPPPLAPPPAVRVEPVKMERLSRQEQRRLRRQASKRRRTR